jgi:hypothetical protein
VHGACAICRVGTATITVVRCAGVSTAIDPDHRPRRPLLATIGVDEPNVFRAMPDGSDPGSRGERPSTSALVERVVEYDAAVRLWAPVANDSERTYGCCDIGSISPTPSAACDHAPAGPPRERFGVPWLSSVCCEARWTKRGDD